MVIVNTLKIKKEEGKKPENSDFLLYNTPNGKVTVEVFLHDETVWLTQAKIAVLFGVDRSVVAKHLKNIYVDKELIEEATCAKFAQVQIEGERHILRNIDYYNLHLLVFETFDQANEDFTKRLLTFLHNVVVITL